MKETLKRIKADVILSALLCVALGVVLIIWSDETINLYAACIWLNCYGYCKSCGIFYKSQTDIF